MAEIKFISFDDRIKKIRNNNVFLCNKETEVQRIIDIVRFSSYMRSDNKMKIECSIAQPSYYIPNHEIIFRIENIHLDSFIEEILGRLHRKLNVFWRLDLIGDEKDPVFMYYTQYSEIDIFFKLKEGEFKSCVIKSVVKKPSRLESYRIPEQTQLIMECM